MLVASQYSKFNSEYVGAASIVKPINKSPKRPEYEYVLPIRDRTYVPLTFGGKSFAQLGVLANASVTLMETETEDGTDRGWLSPGQVNGNFSRQQGHAITAIRFAGTMPLPLTLLCQR